MLARWAEYARVCQRAGWLGAAIACCALASAGPLHALELTACTDAQSSAAALRECTALLQSSGVSDQDRIGLFLRRGQAWLSEEEPAEAVADCARILSLDAAHEQALILRARSNTALGKHKLAAEDWTVVIAHASGGARMRPPISNALRAGSPPATSMRRLPTMTRSSRPTRRASRHSWDVATFL